MTPLAKILKETLCMYVVCLMGTLLCLFILLTQSARHGMSYGFFDWALESLIIEAVDATLLQQKGYVHM